MGMKKHDQPYAAYITIIVAIAYCMNQPVFAQQYRAGVPVCDTILVGSEYGACDPYDVLLFGLGPSLIPYVTGLNFQIVITEAHSRI